MAFHQKRKLAVQLRYLTFLTSRLINDKRLFLPLYIYCVLISALAALIYELMSLFPRTEVFEFFIGVFVVVLVALSLGSAFWRLSLRHIMIALHLRQDWLSMREDESRLARHLRPDFPLLSNGEGFWLRYVYAAGYALLFAISRFESEIIQTLIRMPFLRHPSSKESFDNTSWPSKD